MTVGLLHQREEKRLEIRWVRVFVIVVVDFGSWVSPPLISINLRYYVLQVIDDIVIMDSEDETFKPAGSKLTSDTLAQIDEILYADIGKVQKTSKVGKVSSFRKNLLSHVKP